MADDAGQVGPADRSGVGSAASRIVMVLLLVATVAGAGCTSSDESRPEAGDRLLSRTEFEEKLRRACSSHLSPPARFSDTKTWAQFVRLQEESNADLLSFLEVVKDLETGGDMGENFAEVLELSTSLAEATKTVLEASERSHAEYFSANVERTKLAEDLYFKIRFAELPWACQWLDQNNVLSSRFFARAQEACFHFHDDVVELLAEAFEGPGGRSPVIGPEFAHAFRDRLTQLVSDIGTAVPGTMHGGGVTRMLSMYSHAATLIGYIEDASRDADRERVRKHFRSYVRLIVRANRIAKTYNLHYCTAGITQEVTPEPAPDLKA
jgi:hypothetical protein